MIKIQPTENYDAIVIGSGIGGMTVASLLTQLGKKRVLLLERHFKLGGYTHAFRRGKYEWDVGVHYIGEMHADKLCRRVMDLVTNSQVLWHRCGPIVERFHFPEGTFEVPDDPAKFKERLIERFPEERKNIIRYFRDVKRCQSWFARFFMSKMLPPFLAKLLTLPGRRLAETITAEYLKNFSSQFLKGILTAQWPDFGAPPEESAFAFHSAVTADFFHGSFYPLGGSGVIAEAVEKIVNDGGGACLVNHDVQEIVVENGKAVGVRAIHKNREVVYRAPMIVSNANAITTFGKFVPEGYCKAEKEQARRVKHGTSAMALFIGLNDDPRNHGFDDANYWFYSTSDHDNQPAKTHPYEVHGGYLSFGSLRNPGMQAHTAQIVTFSQYDLWKQFADSPWKRRGEEYEKLKAEMTEKILQFAERYVPQLRPIIDYVELSTPVTFETFSGHPSGMVYGQMADPNRLNRDQWRISTSLPNLYLAGSDIGSPGVNGSLMASVFTAVKLLGPSAFLKIFGSDKPKKTP